MATQCHPHHPRCRSRPLERSYKPRQASSSPLSSTPSLSLLGSYYHLTIMDNTSFISSKSFRGVGLVGLTYSGIQSSFLLSQETSSVRISATYVSMVKKGGHGKGRGRPPRVGGNNGIADCEQVLVDPHVGILGDAAINGELAEAQTNLGIGAAMDLGHLPFCSIEHGSDPVLSKLPTNPTKSPIRQWSSLFKESQLECSRLSYVEPQRIDGKVVVSPPQEAIKERITKWEKSLEQLQSQSIFLSISTCEEEK
uniref:Uncharacterized protein n=1 Tax=Fagus sylvatica TaxID=28930 RepID=A0A2N9EGV4_FAGSY